MGSRVIPVKTQFMEVLFAGAASFMLFVNGILASGFGAAAYYLYTYHKCNEEVRRNHSHDDPPCDVQFRVSTIVMFVVLGMFVGFLTKSSIEALMLANAMHAEFVRFLAAATDPATGMAGFLFMPILDTLMKLPIGKILERVFRGR